MSDAIIRVPRTPPRAGNRTELTEDLAEQLLQKCSSCPDLETTARACRVEPDRLRDWLKEGQKPGAAPLFR